MPECTGCGGWVSRDYTRVFGASDGTVGTCPECASFGDRIRGGVEAGDGGVVR